MTVNAKIKTIVVLIFLALFWSKMACCASMLLMKIFDQTDKDDDALLYLMHFLEIWYMWHETTNKMCLLCIIHIVFLYFYWKILSYICYRNTTLKRLPIPICLSMNQKFFAYCQSTFHTPSCIQIEVQFNFFFLISDRQTVSTWLR